MRQGLQHKTYRRATTVGALLAVLLFCAACASSSSVTSGGGGGGPAQQPAATAPGRSLLPRAACPLVDGTLQQVQQQLGAAPTGPVPAPLQALADGLQAVADRAADPVTRQRIQDVVDNLAVYRATGSLDGASRADAWQALHDLVQGLRQACA